MAHNGNTVFFKVQNISFLAALFFVLKLFFDLPDVRFFCHAKFIFKRFFFLEGNFFRIDIYFRAKFFATKIFFSVAKFIFERNFFTMKFCSPNKRFLLRTMFFCLVLSNRQ